MRIVLECSGIDLECGDARQVAAADQLWCGCTGVAKRRAPCQSRPIAGGDPYRGHEPIRRADGRLLLGASGTSDVVDAHVALLADPGDLILTSDPADISRLTATRRVDAVVQKV